MRHPADRSIGACALAACLMLSACGTSSFEPFEDESSGSTQAKTVEGAAIKSIMASIGAIDPTEKPVEYKPRGKLVVPPKKGELRAPEDPNAYAARGNFPVNPEERRVGEQLGDGGRVLTPDEQKRYANLPTERPQAIDTSKMSAAELEELHKRALANASRTNGKRKTLIDPPDAYVQPSPKAPYQEAEEKSSWKPGWWPF